MYLVLLSILGLALRLVNINKLEGLWNDEYVSWFVASTPFREGFFQEILKQCHMPLYYFYLKPFANCSDVILRLTSVLPSIIAIPVMYLVGKEYSPKVGKIAATITATLPFLVYYSQEVRFYSLLFLFCALSLLFTIRLIKDSTHKNQILWGLSFALILLTHVLGGIYVFSNVLYVIYKKKEIPKKFLMMCVPLGVIVAFLGLNILKMLPFSQWWGVFGYSNLLFLFSDFLSPILTNNINAPRVFFYTKDLICLILMTIPTIIAVIGLILGIKKEKGFALVGLLTILGMVILAITGKIVFITKYSIEVLPILILLISLGFDKKFGNILLGTLLFFYLASVFTPYYPARIFRNEGNKLAADLINSANSDYVVYTYYAPNRFYRYLSKDLKSKALTIDKTARFEYKDHPEKILANIKSGETVSVLILNSVSFVPEKYLNSPEIPEMFTTFSKIKLSLVSALDKNYKNYRVQNNGAWILITAKKR